MSTNGIVVGKNKATTAMRSDTAVKAILTIILGFLGILFILPFLWMISASVKDVNEVFTMPIKWFPSTFRLENYRNIWLHPYYPLSIAFFNSVKVSVLSIAGALITCSMAAYAFAKIDFKGKNIIFMLFLAVMMVPQHITLIPRFALFYWMGLFDTHTALILPNIFNVMGIFLLRQFYLSIPKELSESAWIDGANNLKIWYSIMLPLTKPAMASLVILLFSISWNQYIDPLVLLKSKSLFTIPINLTVYISTEGQHWNYVMAGATISIMPLLITFFILQNQFIQGITSTGIKG